MFVCGGGGGRVLLCAQRLYYRRDQLDCPPPNGLKGLNKTGAQVQVCNSGHYGPLVFLL